MTSKQKIKKSSLQADSQKKTVNKALSLFYLLLRISVIGILIAQFFNGNFENVMLCVLTLILFAIPPLIERRLKIEIPDTLEVIILLFIYAAEILGEIRSYYTAFPAWDTMLHTINGFLCAAIGFSLIDILNRNDRFKFSLSPFYLALFAFCFSMTIGVLWEFFEFGMDQFFGKDMQKDTIIQSFQTVLLDPAKGTLPITVDDIRDDHREIRRFPDRTRTRRLPGYRNYRHDGRSFRQFHRRVRIFHSRLFLHQEQRQRKISPPFYSGQNKFS